MKRKKYFQAHKFHKHKIRRRKKSRKIYIKSKLILFVVYFVIYLFFDRQEGKRAATNVKIFLSFVVFRLSEFLFCVFEISFSVFIKTSVLFHKRMQMVANGLFDFSCFSVRFFVLGLITGSRNHMNIHLQQTVLK